MSDKSFKEEFFFSIKNLSHRFYKKNKAVDLFDKISLDFNQGEMIGIIGKSGIGKSTFLNLAAGLDNPLSGEIFFEGKNLVKMKESELAEIRNKKIGFIFQQFNLIRELNVLENVMLPGMIYSFNKKKLEKQATNLLEMVGLGDRLGYFIGELSGGEKQRTAIARSLVNEPKLIFADEPTGNLDEKNSLEIFTLLKNLCYAKDCSVLLVTHSIFLANKCDKVFEIKNKSLVEYDF